MKTQELERLSDEELHAVVKAAGEIIERRVEERRRQAIEEARERLADVGLSFEEAAAAVGTKKRRRKGPKYVKGARYVNPEDPEQVWIGGRGRPPGWLSALAERGDLPAPEVPSAEG